MLQRASWFSALFFLSACGESGLESLEHAAVFEPQTLSFGDVPIGYAQTLTAKLQNVGTAKLVVSGSEVSDGFALPDALIDQIIDARQELALRVTFLPELEGPVEGHAIVTLGDISAELLLTGNGVDVAVPVLSVDPEVLDFGGVAVSADLEMQATIHNDGNADAFIEDTLQSGADNFALVSPESFTVPANGSVQVTVAFSPTASGDRHGRLTFMPSGLPGLELQLDGRGDAGDLVCTPSPVDFGQVERGLVEERQVTCTAQGGVVDITSATIASGGDPYFEVSSGPAALDLQPDDQVVMSVRYTPDGLPMHHEGQLRIVHSGGTVTVDLLGEVIAPPPSENDISLLLTWNKNDTDVDLHLVRPSGATFNNTSDCYFANPEPEWGNASLTSDNPFLDDDDINGYGPENINLSEAAAGSYKVYVHYYSDNSHGAASSTLEIHLAGELVATVTRNLSCDDLWLAGTIVWDGVAGTFTQTNTLQGDIGEGDCN